MTGHLHVTRKAVSSDLLLPVTWQSGKEKRYGILIRLFASVLTRYQYLVEIYSVSAEKIISDAFSYSENV